MINLKVRPLLSDEERTRKSMQVKGLVRQDSTKLGADIVVKLGSC